jgi:hypothetical protein
MLHRDVSWWEKCGTVPSGKGKCLSAYAGQAITLKFTGAEDSELQTSFVIDDTALNVS